MTNYEHFRRELAERYSNNKIYFGENLLVKYLGLSVLFPKPLTTVSLTPPTGTPAPSTGFSIQTKAKAENWISVSSADQISVAML